MSTHRARPAATDTAEFGPSFDALCASARVHWRTELAAAGPDDPVVVVDLMMQDLRLALRTLTLANALRRNRPARLLALLGPDPVWERDIWDFYDRDRLTQLATAYGAVGVLDVGAAAEQVAAGASAIDVLGASVPVARGAPASTTVERTLVDSSIVRLLRIPTVGHAEEADDVPAIRARSAAFTAVYETLLTALPVTAVVMSHVDYAHWGSAATAATRHGVPVLHAQATGGFKAYALFPEAPSAELGFRRALTLGIARQFEEQVWAHRAVLQPRAERTVWRSKSNLGRPSWWRGGGEVSRLDLHGDADRTALRADTLTGLGLDPDKPTITVFAHAVSDAVQGNHEAFPDLSAWIHATVEFSAAHDEVNWLFLDHPKQMNYDRTEEFEQLGRQFGDRSHLAFRPSLSLSKNRLWSVTDLAVTVRGSVSNEFPAYGVPALQAGWSEWSHCGFTMRADTVDDYWAELERCIGALSDGTPLIGPEHVARARLWLWFYRSGADVNSSVVPHWEFGQRETLHQAVVTAMNHVESDADPAILAVERLWANHDPVLTRLDLHGSDADVLAAIGGAGGIPAAPESSGDGLVTIHDDHVVPEPPLRIRSGQDVAVRMVEGFTRGVAVVGRAGAARSLLVIDTGLATAGSAPREVRVTVTLAQDATAQQWWRERSGLPGDPPSHRPLRLALDGACSTVLVPAVGQGPATARLRARSADRLLLLALEADPGSSAARTCPVIGVRVDALDVEVQP